MQNSDIKCDRLVFFSLEEEGIILEGGYTAFTKFFYFCEYALNKYRNNEKIYMINGTNYLGLNKSNKYFILNIFLFGGGLRGKEHGNIMM